MNKTILFLCSFFMLVHNIHSNKSFPLKSIYNPGFMLTNSEKVVVTDTKNNTLHIFHLEGKELSTFGKTGQGPGEWTNIDSVQLLADEIVVSSASKVLFFNYMGKLIKEKKLIKDIYGIKKSKNGWFGYEIEENNHELTRVLYQYQDDFKKNNKIFEETLPSPLSSNIEVVEHCSRIEYSKCLFLANTRSGFLISEYADTGEKLKEFSNKNVQRVNVTSKFKEYMLNELKSAPEIAKNWEMLKNKFFFPKYFPAFNDFAVSENGLLLIRTYLEKNGKNIYYLINNNAQTKYWREIELPENIKYFYNPMFRHFCVGKDMVFYILEDSEGNFSLNKIRLVK